MVAEEPGKLLGLVHFLFHRSTIKSRQLLLAGPSYYRESRGQRRWSRAHNTVYQQANCRGSPRVYWQPTRPIAWMATLRQGAEKSGFVVYRKVL